MANKKKPKSNRGAPRKKTSKDIAFEKEFKKRAGVLFLILILGISVLLPLKTQVFKLLVGAYTYEVDEALMPESRVAKAINLSFDSRRSAYKRAELFKLLSDPTHWFNKNWKLNDRFPSNDDYDLFLYLSKPEVNATDAGHSSYEVVFHGAYRHRVPDALLFSFESGIVRIENGLITSLITKTYPNEYGLGWINPFWRYYFWYCGGAILLVGIIVIFAKSERKLFVSMLKRWFGVH